MIVAKGIMFLAIAGMAAWLIWHAAPGWRTVILLGLVAWASARFYYFLFYLLERYVDPRLRYSGIINLLMTIVRRKSSSGSRDEVSGNARHDDH